MDTPNLENYKIHERLGEGTSGKVHKGRNKESGTNVAIKFIPKKSLSSSGRDNLINEISALKKLKHRFIIQMLDFSYTDKHVYIIMEFADSGDLSTFIKKRKCLQENLARIFCQQLCAALLFMRSYNISHMDLKPSNLLLHRPSPNLNPVLKVADFGFAQNIEGEDDLGLRGSPLYMAPEIFKTKSYTPKVDLWSVGVILFEAVFGHAPFSSSSLEDLIVKIKEDTPIVIPRERKLSSECRRFLSSCLIRDPDDRINFEDLREHPFLELENSIPNETMEQMMLQHGEDAESQFLLGNTKSAIAESKLAVKLATTLYYYGQDEDERRKWKSFVLKYQERLGEMQGRRVTSTIMTATTNNCDQHFIELRQLSKGTPSLADGLEIIGSARNYLLQGDIQQAIDKYTAGLSVLMPILQNEPKGRRRDLLHICVTSCLDQAETLKQSMEAENTNIQKSEELLTGEKDKASCCLQ